jgi:hypothetical protein
MPDDAHQG